MADGWYQTNNECRWVVRSRVSQVGKCDDKREEQQLLESRVETVKGDDTREEQQLLESRE
jgi:3-methyladenine DNA glycosylase AlkC